MATTTRKSHTRTTSIKGKGGTVLGHKTVRVKQTTVKKPKKK